MNLYLKDGWVNMREIFALPMPFVYVIGGRGTGKTFGALDVCITDSIPFALMRRTQTQTDLINNPMLSPIKPVCRARGVDLMTAPIVKGISGFYHTEAGEGGKRIQTGDPIGITCALSTIGNVRGFDGEWIQKLLYDEFIPERGERCLKDESDKFFNAYETLNRNRELAGHPALQAVCMANANDLSAPILVKLGLIRRIEKMMQTSQCLWMDTARGIAVVLLRDSPISSAKASTALYRLTKDTEFSSMALENQFGYEDRGRIISRPLAEYRPIAAIGEITIYRHKSKRLFYVSEHRQGSPALFSTGETDIARYRRSYGWLYRELLDDRIEFETYPAQIFFNKSLDI